MENGYEETNLLEGPIVRGRDDGQVSGGQKAGKTINMCETFGGGMSST